MTEIKEISEKLKANQKTLIANITAAINKEVDEVLNKKNEEEKSEGSNLRESKH